MIGLQTLNFLRVLLRGKNPKALEEKLTGRLLDLSHEELLAEYGLKLSQCSEVTSKEEKVREIYEEFVPNVSDHFWPVEKNSQRTREHLTELVKRLANITGIPIERKPQKNLVGLERKNKKQDSSFEESNAELLRKKIILGSLKQQIKNGNAIEYASYGLERKVATGIINPTNAKEHMLAVSAFSKLKEIGHEFTHPELLRMQNPEEFARTLEQVKTHFGYGIRRI
ncbi:hypothetical protein HUU53_03675 [Candidatus Micrarchaeota archaeon]|nr:hypothetical protein [Candidatus Micrarchaeota archaeon]